MTAVSPTRKEREHESSSMGTAGAHRRLLPSRENLDDTPSRYFSRFSWILFPNLVRGQTRSLLMLKVRSTSTSRKARFTGNRRLSLPTRHERRFSGMFG